MWPEAERRRAPVGDFPPPWASAWGDDPYGLWAEFTVNGVTQCMRWIEPTGPQGFWMGSTQADQVAIRDKDKSREKVQRGQVSRRERRSQAWVKHGFWLADTPCTQALWLAVSGGDNPSHFKGQLDTAERPVERVNWVEDIPSFFTKLTQSLPLQACLPSEVEWEWACRACSSSAYWWGDEADVARANLARSVGETTPVKRYPPNPWGLHDMHGNVWEWCADAWRMHLNQPAVESKTGDAPRVVRGGSWSGSAYGAGSAYRGRERSGARSASLGFRLALRSPGPGGPGI